MIVVTLDILISFRFSFIAYVSGNIVFSNYLLIQYIPGTGELAVFCGSLIGAALFLCVGVIYDRMHSRQIDFYGGLVNKMPVYSTVFMIFMLGSVGLPGTSGFIGEFLVIVGIVVFGPLEGFCQKKK